MQMVLSLQARQSDRSCTPTNAAVLRNRRNGEYLADPDPANYDVEADSAGFKKVKRNLSSVAEPRTTGDFVLHHRHALSLHP